MEYERLSEARSHGCTYRYGKRQERSRNVCINCCDAGARPVTGNSDDGRRSPQRQFLLKKNRGRNLEVIAPEVSPLGGNVFEDGLREAADSLVDQTSGSVPALIIEVLLNKWTGNAAGEAIDEVEQASLIDLSCSVGINEVGNCGTGSKNWVLAARQPFRCPNS